MADVGLGLLYIGAFVAGGLLLAVALRQAGLLADSGDEQALAFGVLSWIGLQLGVGSWPLVVSRVGKQTRLAQGDRQQQPAGHESPDVEEPKSDVGHAPARR
ncbi:MAG: hypothetical protein AAFN30_18055, partial [Actinomycetota bacterium]